jgi:hypothetical protein
METKVIQSIASFLNLLHGLPETDFFRGQSSVGYELKPSIGRLFKPGLESVLPQYEREIFNASRENTLCSQIPGPKMTKSFCSLHSIMDSPRDFLTGLITR